MRRLHINSRPCIEAERIANNVLSAGKRGLPRVSVRERPPLLVLGGGHSIGERLQQVRDSQHDKWIIGSAFRWWHEQGVSGTFFSVHPSPAALVNIPGVQRAILATQTDPAVFDALQTAKVEVFDLESLGGAHGCTSAACAPMLAIQMGYREVTFFGCDGDYSAGTHAYMDVPDPYKMQVKIGRRKFLTGAEFLMQSEFLSSIMRAAPTIYRNQSGGLLAAMVEDPNYDVTHISRTLNDSMKGAHV